MPHNATMKYQHTTPSFRKVFCTLLGTKSLNKLSKNVKKINEIPHTRTTCKPETIRTPHTSGAFIRNINSHQKTEAGNRDPNVRDDRQATTLTELVTNLNTTLRTDDTHEIRHRLKTYFSSDLLYFREKNKKTPSEESTCYDDVITGIKDILAGYSRQLVEKKNKLLAEVEKQSTPPSSNENDVISLEASHLEKLTQEIDKTTDEVLAEKCGKKIQEIDIFRISNNKSYKIEKSKKNYTYLSIILPEDCKYLKNEKHKKEKAQKKYELAFRLTDKIEEIQEKAKELCSHYFKDSHISDKLFYNIILKNDKENYCTLLENTRMHYINKKGSDFILAHNLIEKVRNEGIDAIKTHLKVMLQNKIHPKHENNIASKWLSDITKLFTKKDSPSPSDCLQSNYVLLADKMNKKLDSYSEEVKNETYKITTALTKYLNGPTLTDAKVNYANKKNTDDAKKITDALPEIINHLISVEAGTIIEKIVTKINHKKLDEYIKSVITKKSKAEKSVTEITETKDATIFCANSFHAFINKLKEIVFQYITHSEREGNTDKHFATIITQKTQQQITEIERKISDSHQKYLADRNRLKTKLLREMKQEIENLETSETNKKNSSPAQLTSPGFFKKMEQKFQRGVSFLTTSLSFTKKGATLNRIEISDAILQRAKNIKHCIEMLEKLELPDTDRVQYVAEKDLFFKKADQLFPRKWTILEYLYTFISSITTTQATLTFLTIAVTASISVPALTLILPLVLVYAPFFFTLLIKDENHKINENLQAYRQLKKESDVFCSQSETQFNHSAQVSSAVQA